MSERALVAKVEAHMEFTMAKYDPSHDAHHGQHVYFVLLLAHGPDEVATPYPSLLCVD